MRRSAPICRRRKADAFEECWVDFVNSYIAVAEAGTPIVARCRVTGRRDAHRCGLHEVLRWSELHWAHMKNPMVTANRIKVLAALAGGFLLAFVAPVRAQDGPGPGGFDPAQMRQRMLQRVREQLEVKDDAEWKVVSERIQKVMEARRGLGGPGGFGGFGFMGPGGPPPRPDGVSGTEGGPPSDDSGPPAPPESAAGGPSGPMAFNRPSNPELEALRKAVEAKASSSELKAKLADLRAARAKKEAELEKAQEDLKQVLSVRQEAVAVAFGLLK